MVYDSCQVLYEKKIGTLLPTERPLPFSFLAGNKGLAFLPTFGETACGKEIPMVIKALVMVPACPKPFDKFTLSLSYGLMTFRRIEGARLPETPFNSLRVACQEKPVMSSENGRLSVY